MIIYARFMDLVANVTELFVYIVAGDEDEFPSLVIVVVRDSPQAEFSIVQIVVIEAEEAFVLSFSEIIQRCSWLARRIFKKGEFIETANVMVYEFLVTDSISFAP